MGGGAGVWVWVKGEPVGACCWGGKNPSGGAGRGGGGEVERVERVVERVGHVSG